MDHNGLAFVYFDADKAMALLVLQLPSSEMDPTTLIVWPTTVVTTSLKVTSTLEAMAQVVLVGLVVLVPTDVAAVLVPVGCTLDDWLPPDPLMAMSAQVR